MRKYAKTLFLRKPRKGPGIRPQRKIRMRLKKPQPKKE